MNALPTNLERAARAAVALDLAPERSVQNAARAAAFDILDRQSRGGPRYYEKMSPEGWLSELRLHLPTKQRLRLLRGCRSLPRVWCPELSVLDVEAKGERWVFYVPARAANDTAIPILDGNSRAENLGHRQRIELAQLSLRSGTENQQTGGSAGSKTGASANQHQNGQKALRVRAKRRKPAEAMLTDWLSEEVSP